MEFCCNRATTHNLGTILHFFNNPHKNTKGSADQNNRLVLHKKQYRQKLSFLPLLQLNFL
jgi:hypothetical protein